MNCPKCNTKISELDGKCPKCGLILEGYEKEREKEKEENEDETKTKGLVFINVIQLIGCIIMAIIYGGNEETFIGFVILISGIIAFFFIKGFVDIINLLDSINSKLDKQ